MPKSPADMWSAIIRNLPQKRTSPRRSEAGSFGSGSITHKLTPTSVVQVDDQLRGWLGEACDAAAPAR
jgi:hypothetical protein